MRSLRPLWLLRPESGVRIKEIVPNVYQIQLGVVNSFLIAGHDLTLIDTGLPGSAPQIARAVASLGRAVREIRHILISHVHPDHAGSLAEMKRLTGAAIYMHPLDIEVLRGEEPGNCLEAAPGLANRALWRLFGHRPPWQLAPAFVEHEVMDGDVLDVTGPVEALHVPGHCAGQLAFLYHYRPNNGAVLFAADTARNVFGGLTWSMAYESLDCGRRSLAKLAGKHFDVVCFGHGIPIIGEASSAFRARWGVAQPEPICE